MPACDGVEEAQCGIDPEWEDGCRQAVCEQWTGGEALERIAGGCDGKQRHCECHDAGEDHVAHCVWLLFCFPGVVPLAIRIAGMVSVTGTACALQVATRPAGPIGCQQLHAGRPDQPGSHNPYHVQGGVHVDGHSEHCRKFDQPCGQQVEHGRVERVVRPQVGSRADALIENLTNEVIVSWCVDFVQRIVPCRAPLGEPSNHDRACRQHAQYHAYRDRQTPRPFLPHIGIRITRAVGLPVAFRSA